MANHYSITEIAKLAGVSATTVSRVFHGDGYVKEE
ncbi:MAG: LacI family DNA-binding transcriptional regulator, partial [Clostridia bacterium]